MFQARMAKKKNTNFPEIYPSSLTAPRRRFPASLVISIFFPILVLLILYLFWEAIVGIPKQHCLWSMDGSPLYNHDFKAQTWRELTGRDWHPAMLGIPGPTRVFQPDDLLKFIFPPLVYHIMSWICAFLLMTGAMLYFLYSHGIKGLKAAIPALAYGFSGYTFTLISAGHRATPMTMGYAVLAMALIRDGILKNTISHFVAAGLACVYGIINQMDVMGFLLILIAAYALLQLILHWPMYQKTEDGRQKTEDGEPRAEVSPEATQMTHNSNFVASLARAWADSRKRRDKPSTSHIPPLAKLAAAIALATTTFLLVGWPFLSQTFFGASTGRSTLESRQQQIEKTGGNRWEFITNWSLPPEGILEFIAPSVFGRENVSRRVPYWGRLGQAMSWAETGEGFRNFRQHNLYIGGIQIAFAFYALFALFQQGSKYLSRKRRMEIIFLLSASGLTLLLALGRYTPLYRVIYNIPVLGNIRAPVKWFHLTEITIVILMAFGLDALLKDLQAIAARQIDHKKNKNDHAPRLPVRFAIGTTITAVVLLIAAAIAQSTGFGLQSLWAAHGLEPIAPQLRNAMAGSLFHAALVFAALSAILWLLLKQAEEHRQQTTNLANQHSLESLPSSVFRLLSVLLLVLALDLAIAHKPYIHVQDVSAFYAPNPIADIVLEHAPLCRVADYLTTRGKHDPILRNFLMKKVDMLFPGNYEQAPEDVQSLFRALNNNPIRLWQLTSTRFIMGQRKQFSSFLGHPDIHILATFRITHDARVILDQSPQAPYALLEYNKALPRVQLYHAWEAVPDPTTALERLADPHFNPMQKALVIGNMACSNHSTIPPADVEIHSYSPELCVIKFSIETPGILVFTDRYYVNRTASIAPPLRCNANMQGVAVDPKLKRLTITLQSTWGTTANLTLNVILLSFLFVNLCLAATHPLWLGWGRR